MSTGPRRSVEPPTVNESPFPVESEDPTATKDLRNRYAAQMTRRFEALAAVIQEAVVERDVFGIGDLSPEDRAGPSTPASSGNTSDGFAAAARHGGAGAGINIEPPRPGEFAFPSDQRKVKEFNAWLAQQVNRGILEADPSAEVRTRAADEAWQNTYIRQAYSKGVTHADAYLVDQGIIPPGQTLDDVFRATKHADSAGLIFTRAYNELDGVTDAMAQDMTRVLAEGLTQGLNPREIARQLNERVENVGIHRGRLIARTETIRAHNEAALNRYEDMGDRLTGVTMLAEHITAQDNRVCEECASLSGQVYTIREARGRIPVHPQCRCTWVPVDSRDVRPGQGGTATAAERVDEFFDATADLPPDEQVARVSEWLSENTRLGADRRPRPPVDLSGFDPERAHGVANALMKMEHADVLEGIPGGHVSVTTAADVANSPGLGQAIAWAKRDRVTFNADLFTEDRLSRLVDEGWLTGRFARRPVPPLEHGAVHEFGHVLHYQNLIAGSERRKRAALTGRFSPQQRDEISGKISRYASTNPMEFVAESFVRIAYDLPMSPHHLAVYQRFSGPDAETYRGFMVAEDDARNMGDNSEATRDRAGNAEETAFGDVPEDLPPELRAEAEVVFEAFAEGLDEAGLLEGDE